MRKALIRTRDKTIEVDLTDDEVYALLELHFASIASSKTRHGSLLSKKKKGFQIHEECERLTTTKTQSRGREGKSMYVLYRDKNNGSIIGMSEARNRWVNIGNPYDASSMISKIMKAVNSMSLNRDFTRNDLKEVLSPNLFRGDYLKCALDYMEYKQLIKTAKERDIETGAIRYIRTEQTDKVSEQNKLESKYKLHKSQSQYL